MGEDSVKIAEFMKEKQLFVPDGEMPAAARRDHSSAMSPIFFNYDDCIVQGRDSNGNLIADQQAFPNGMLAVSQQLNKMGFRAGFYTDRG